MGGPLGLMDHFAATGTGGTGTGTGTGGLGGGLSGLLSTKILDARLKLIGAQTTPMGKIQAAIKTLGLRLKGGKLPGGGTLPDTGTIWRSYGAGGYQAGPAVRGLNIDFGDPDVQWG